MLVQSRFAIQGMEEVRRVIAANPWALLVSSSARGLAAAHLVCLVDPERDPGGDSEELVLVGHTARADPSSKDLIDGCEVLLIFQGPSGYISSSWYGTDPAISTWNFVAVHVYGAPQVLEGEESFSVLRHTIEHFESARARRWRLGGASLEYARQIAPGTVPFRLHASEVQAKAKLSQDKPAETQDRVIAALERSGPYHEPQLAAEMRHFLGRERSS